jgi:hypothetical protein
MDPLWPTKNAAVANKTGIGPDGYSSQPNGPFDVARVARTMPRPHVPQGLHAGGGCVIVQFRELSIGEMLADPIVRAVMSADGVDAGELELMLRLIADRVSERARPRAAFPRGCGASARRA